MIATVAGRLGAHLAAGSLGFCAVLSLSHPLPLGLLRFCALAAALLGSASALLAADRLGFLLRAAVALVAYGWFALLRRSAATESEERPHPDRPQSGVAVAGLALFVSLAAVSLEPCAPGRLWLCTAGSLGSAFLLGSTAVSLLLGHWYLVEPKLSISPFKTGALGFICATLWRTLVVALTVLAEGGPALRLTTPADLVYSTPALFFLMRAVTGLAGPLLLAGLIWQTVKMRSTQSATGLLYVAVILVLFGELIAHFLTLTTGLPL
jgi:hypothetical protein